MARYQGGHNAGHTVYANGRKFVLRLLPADKARVGAFNDKIEFGDDFTNNRDALVSSLRDLDFGNGTRLWDAVSASLDELRPLEGRPAEYVNLYCER